MNTLKIRNSIERAADLKAIIDGAKDELDAIMGQFKAEGDGDYAGRDGHKIQVRTSVSQVLDTKAAKVLLTPAQIAACTVTRTSVSAKLV